MKKAPVELKFFCMPDCDCIPINNSNVLNGLHIMTEQQKQTINESFPKMVEDVLEYVETYSGHSQGDDITEEEIYEAAKTGVLNGMKEIISNPEKYGLQPINEWVSVKDRLPLTWESGEWGGRRSDEVLIMKTNNRYTIGRVYHGVIDGNMFTDWIEGKEEWLIDSGEVTHWQPLPQLQTDVEPK